MLGKYNPSSLLFGKLRLLILVLREYKVFLHYFCSSRLWALFISWLTRLLFGSLVIKVYFSSSLIFDSFLLTILASLSEKLSWGSEVFLCSEWRSHGFLLWIFVLKYVNLGHSIWLICLNYCRSYENFIGGRSSAKYAGIDLREYPWIVLNS